MSCVFFKVNITSDIKIEPPYMVLFFSGHRSNSFLNMFGSKEKQIFLDDIYVG